MALYAISILPFLDANSHGQKIRIGNLTLDFYPSDDREESEELLKQHKAKIFNSFHCRHPVYMWGGVFENWDDITDYQNKQLIPHISLRYGILSQRIYRWGHPVSLEHMDLFNLVFHPRDKTGQVYGYESFRNGEHFKFLHSDEQWSFDNPGVGATFDDDIVRILYESMQSDSRITASIEWFNKSHKKTSDVREQLIALSIALEGILAVDQDTSEAELELRNVIESAAIPNNTSGQYTDRIIKASKRAQLLKQGLARGFREKILALTNSKQLQDFCKEFYSVGSGIRHGDGLFETDVMWFGKHQHLYRPDLLRRLFVFILRYSPKLGHEHKIELRAG